MTPELRKAAEYVRDNDGIQKYQPAPDIADEDFIAHAKMLAVIVLGKYDACRMRLDLAKQSLVDAGYFRECEVDEDIAPRIGEMMIAIQSGKWTPEPFPKEDED